MFHKLNCKYCGKIFDEWRNYRLRDYGSYYGLCLDCTEVARKRDAKEQKRREEWSEKNKRKEECSHCNGTERIKGYKCIKCDGKGYWWYYPD